MTLSARRSRLALKVTVPNYGKHEDVKISEIRVYQIDLPLVEGRYSWSEGKYVEVFDSTVVELVTDDGLSGYGEVCPLGPFYLPAFGPGARAGIAELSGSLIGQDPTAIGPINQLMDRALLGHPYVKSAIEATQVILLYLIIGSSKTISQNSGWRLAYLT